MTPAKRNAVIRGVAQRSVRDRVGGEFAHISVMSAQIKVAADKN